MKVLGELSTTELEQLVNRAKGALDVPLRTEEDAVMAATAFAVLEQAANLVPDHQRESINGLITHHRAKAESALNHDWKNLVPRRVV